MVELLIRGVGVPIGIAVVMLAALAQPWRSTPLATRSWTAGVTVAVAFTGGFVALFGWPSAPPAESWQWLAYLLIPVAAIGAGLTLERIPYWLHPLLAMVLSASAAWLVLPGFVEEHRVWWIAAITASMLVNWATILAVSRRIHSAMATAAIMVIITAASILLARHTGNAKLGQLAGAVAAPLGVCMVVAIWRKHSIVAATFAAPVSVVHVGLVACGYFNSYSETPVASYLLITLSPIALIGAWIPAVTKLKTLPRIVVSATPCIIVIAIGLLLAEYAYAQDVDAY